MDQQPIQNFQPETQPKKLLNKTWQIAAIVVAGILIIGGVSYGSYYLWQNSGEKVSQNTSPSPSVSVSPFIVSSASIDCGSAGKFISENLGIAFCYAKQMYGKETDIKTVGNKVYVGGLDGQSVEVFQKDKNDTLEDAIKKTFLRGYSEKDCFVAKSQKSDQNPVSYISGGYIMDEAIDYPEPTNSDSYFWENAKSCPAGYSRANGIRYFLMDEKHSDIFLFFDIGQYIIPVDASLSTDRWVPWQNTIKFLDVSDIVDWQTYKNEQYGFEVKYPKEWQEFKMPIYEGNALEIIGFGLVNDSRQSLPVQKVAISISPETPDFLNKIILNSVNPILSEIEIGQTKWTRIEYSINVDPIPKEKRIKMVALDKNKIYSIEANKADEMVLNQIFSTFKFTK